jgi:hypothetical protein
LVLIKLVLKDQLVHKDHLDHQDLVVQLVQPVQLVQLDRQVQQELLALLALQAPSQDQLVLLAQQDLLVQQAQLELHLM